MAQALRVHQGHRAAELLQQRGRLLLRVRSDLGQVVEELAALHQLANNVVVRLALVVRLGAGSGFGFGSDKGSGSRAGPA